MRLRLTKAVAAVAVAANLSSGAAAADCLSRAELDAHKIRHLQTQLMVGALRCRGANDLGQRDNYNRFINRHHFDLEAGRDRLTDYFKRTHGGAYQAAMDRHVTALANRISRQSQNMVGYCEQIAALGDVLTASRAADLVEAIEIAPIQPDVPAGACHLTAEGTTKPAR